MVLIYLEMLFSHFYPKKVLYPFHINTQARTTKRHPYDGITCADNDYGTENAIHQANFMP